MALSDKLYQYCERGQDAAFHAEPLNAYSNFAFVVAGAGLMLTAIRQPSFARTAHSWLLAGLVLSIGVGSFLFHTFATKWAAAADVIPIAVFIVVYLAVALNAFLKVPPGSTLLIILLFAASSQALGSMACSGATMPVGVGSSTGGWCLHGSIGYVPALAAMWIVGGLCARQNHPATTALFKAAGIFALSLTFRTIDMPLCDGLSIGDSVVGSHSLWHILNALVLFLLGKAAIRFGTGDASTKVLTPIR